VRRERSLINAIVRSRILLAPALEEVDGGRFQAFVRFAPYAFGVGQVYPNLQTRGTVKLPYILIFLPIALALNYVRGNPILIFLASALVSDTHAYMFGTRS
jgi:hypothetical protein